MIRNETPEARKARLDAMHQGLTELANALAATKARNAEKRRQVWQAMRDNGQLVWSQSLGRWVTIPED